MKVIIKILWVWFRVSSCDHGGGGGVSTTLIERGGESSNEAIEAGVAGDAFVGVEAERGVEGFLCEGVGVSFMVKVRWEYGCYLL